MRPSFTPLLFAATLTLSGLSQAQTTLLSDTFDTENGGQGVGVYSGFANFSASDVDLLGPGYFFHLCQAAGGSTPCVDMQGNGNGTLTTRATYELQPGQVTLQFDLAGDQRGSSSKSVTTRLVDIFGQMVYSETFSLASDARFTSYLRTVELTQAATVRLQFASSGPADSFGMLLDNVALSVSAVPEAATAWQLAAGLGALVLVAGRRRPQRHAVR